MKDFESTQFVAYVHTLSFITKDIIYRKDEIPYKPRYVKKICRYNDGTLFQVNLNEIYGEIYSAWGFQNVLHEVMNDLGIKCIKVTRMDFCFNLVVDYEECYKINDVIKKLYALHIHSINSYYTNGDDHKKRSTKVDSRTTSLEIYNKEIESNGQSPYRTRIEFRFYRGKPLCGIFKLVEHLLNGLYRLPMYFEQLEDQQLMYLCDAYEREIQKDYEGRILSLSGFITKYANSFFSYKMTQRFYNIYKKGKFKAWLCQYRKQGHVITFYTQKDVKNYISLLQQCLSDYSK